ncbi:hypothetical protein H310_11267 [Aphanomyces invadans]|uniref:Peptidase C1A papain C-terminal domain-containing protein n=1 Tax=Aphanomyces invadans TaxID=157072 RepID=A0A024TP60_9STRA|nr:hypothetical protein H310_11267 [Aphanomyces invadans]ETV95386.1 hypothetical protein H310_11267 [Aphanomyces invadans]|eukprot:XP_008876087.1 hypothetical protein H310_11267 [Aphanomyces invadans]
MARSKKGAHKQEEKPNAEQRERLLEETTYHDMDTPVSAEPGFVTRKVQRNRAWCSFVWLGLIAVGVVGIIAILKASKQADEFPTKKPSFPSQYEASLTFRMPYMNLVEPVFVHVDEMLGAQKLSFYGGTQEYILNVSGPSFQLIPVIASIRCIADGPSSLQHIFPDLSRFEPVYGKTLVNSIDCFSWKYDVAGSPDNSSYFGTYKLFVNAATNEPVQFHFVGHNVILGGSHTDEYIIDYNYVRAGPVAPQTFHYRVDTLNCTKGDDEAITVPSMTPWHDLHMRMPEGHAARMGAFDTFTRTHSKTYNATETARRASIFHSNLQYINAMNRKGLSYSLAMNHLGDLTPNEMKAFLGHKTVKRALDNRAGGVYEVQNIALPDEWDWRTKGGVTPVKDQGNCGSCWTFGTTGALEGQWFRKTNQTVEFSQQNLLDCSWDEGNNACNGGLDYQAYRWIIKHGGLEPEVTYGTYKNLPGFCHFNASNALAAVTSYVNISGVQALNEALVTVGPLSVSIDATPPSFYFYSGGYYNDLNCKSGIDDLDHSVVAVGYTKHLGKTYTLVKNSWSTHWGDNGYVKIAQEDNICGVATSPTYPVLA